MTTIRAAQESDLPAILDIYNDAILTTTAVYDYQPHTLDMRQQWFHTKQTNGFPVLVAEEAAHVVGFGAIGPFRAWAAYQYTVEHSLYVASAHRGQGIGKHLLGNLITAAQQMQMHALIAGVDAQNQVSYQLHQSFGFEEVAHFKQVGYKFGRWLDLKFLELLLPISTSPTPQHS